MPIHSTTLSPVNLSNHSSQLDIREEARNTLCLHIQQAENLNCLNDRIQEYENILSTDQLESLLTKEEIGNIFWNKALDHSCMADEYYNGQINGRQQLVPALRHQQLAIADMTTAKFLYENTHYAETAQNEMQGMTHSLQLITEKLKESSAVLPEEGTPNHSTLRC